MTEEPKPFSLKERRRSFRFAFSGLFSLIRLEHNFRIHLLAAILACALAFFLKISTAEWLILVLVIALVLVSEALNSAMEQLASFVSPEKNERIRKVKDYCAAAVLISSLAAILAGGMIFLPKLISLLQKSG